MIIKVPVYVDHDETESAWWVADADGEPVDLFEITAALNATQPAPGVTAAVTRILDTLEEQGVATWGVLSNADAEACRADAARAITPLVASLAAAPDLTALQAAVSRYHALVAETIETPMADARFLHAVHAMSEAHANMIAAALALFPQA